MINEEPSTEQKLKDGLSYTKKCFNSPRIELINYIHHIFFLTDWKSYLKFRQPVFGTTWKKVGNQPISEELCDLIYDNSDKSFAKSFLSDVFGNFDLFSTSESSLTKKEKQTLLEIIKTIEANDKKPDYIDEVTNATFAMLMTKNREEIDLFGLSKKRVLWNDRLKQKVEESDILN